jgi:acyl carrier protein
VELETGKTKTNVDVFKMFGDFVAKVEGSKKVGTITREHKFAELGIDSLGMMEVIGYFEDELGIMLPDEKLAGLQTVGDVERVVLLELKNKAPSA